MGVPSDSHVDAPEITPTCPARESLVTVAVTAGWAATCTLVVWAPPVPVRGSQLAQVVVAAAAGRAPTSTAMSTMAPVMTPLRR